MSQLDERTYSFIVKLWEEHRELEDAEPTWRGSMDDVQSGTRLYFRSLDELCNLLCMRSGMVIQPAARHPVTCRARKPRAG